MSHQARKTSHPGPNAPGPGKVSPKTTATGTPMASTFTGSAYGDPTLASTNNEKFGTGKGGRAEQKRAESGNKSKESLEGKTYDQPDKGDKQPLDKQKAKWQSEKDDAEYLNELIKLILAQAPIANFEPKPEGLMDESPHQTVPVSSGIPGYVEHGRNIPLSSGSVPNTYANSNIHMSSPNVGHPISYYTQQPGLQAPRPIPQSFPTPTPPQGPPLIGQTSFQDSRFAGPPLPPEFQPLISTLSDIHIQLFRYGTMIEKCLDSVGECLDRMQDFWKKMDVLQAGNRRARYHVCFFSQKARFKATDKKEYRAILRQIDDCGMTGVDNSDYKDSQVEAAKSLLSFQSLRVQHKILQFARPLTI